MANLKFSGHETFYCRHFWLKKGFDFLNQDNEFKAQDAVVKLGVGKNMVGSIGHWLKSFGLTTGHNRHDLTPFSSRMFGKNGFDPFLEDEGSLYLLHYKIVSSNYASIYNIAFSEFRKNRISNEFTLDHLVDYFSRKLQKEGASFSPTSVRNDVKVFLRMYLPNQKRSKKTIEDDFSAILLGLPLLRFGNENENETEKTYKFNFDKKEGLPHLIFLHCILDVFGDRTSISFDEIDKAISDVFLCDRVGIESKLLLLEEKGYLVYKSDAGRKEIQLKEKAEKWEVLNKYYGIA